MNWDVLFSIFVTDYILHKKPQKTVRPNCKANSKTLMQMLTNCWRQMDNIIW